MLQKTRNLMNSINIKTEETLQILKQDCSIKKYFNPLWHHHHSKVALKIMLPKKNQSQKNLNIQAITTEKPSSNNLLLNKRTKLIHLFFLYFDYLQLDSATAIQASKSGNNRWCSQVVRSKGSGNRIMGHKNNLQKHHYPVERVLCIGGAKNHSKNYDTSALYCIVCMWFAHNIKL